jgi:hypothetical protein
MRTNAVGEKFCHDADEITALIEEADGSNVVAAGLEDDPDHDPENDESLRWGCELREDDSGDIIGYVETDTEDELRAVLEEADVPIVVSARKPRVSDDDGA